MTFITSLCQRKEFSVVCMHAKASVCHLFVGSKTVFHPDLKCVSVHRTHAVQLVASFGVKPQLCQLKLKTTHGPKQDIKKRVHSSLTSPVQPLVGVYCMHFSVKETDLTTLYNCFVKKWTWLLPSRDSWTRFEKGCILYAKAQT